MFADDTKCLQTVHSFSDCLSLQNDLQHLFCWSQLWNLHFNDKKCFLLRFSPKCSQIPFNYTLNNKLIATMGHHRDLGVIMSHNLSWREHLKYISQRQRQHVKSGVHEIEGYYYIHGYIRHRLFVFNTFFMTTSNFGGAQPPLTKKWGGSSPPCPPRFSASVSSRAYKFLGLIRHSFSGGHHPGTKKILYITLIRSQLTYCSQKWRPHFLKDIATLERIQRRATKFILNDFSSDYRSHLVTLRLLPLMMQLELNDIMFL